MDSPTPPEAPWPERARRGAGGAARRYADWLAALSWKRFVLVALLALIGAGILGSLPPFDIPWGPDRHVVRPPPELPPEALRDFEVHVGKDSIRIGPRELPTPPVPPEPGASAPPSPPPLPLPRIEIPLPDGAEAAEIREAVEEAKQELREALRGEPRVRVVRAFTPGEYLPQLVMLLIVASILVKVMSTGRRKAEARAAEATEMAEGEALKRQVVEARMAAMQAQVEPHFLFNTLASIDHLIETDSARASRMQKNLIALLRASMPTMRETAATGAPRDLGRELAVVRPYLEILKMRMEERLQVRIDVPDGLLSAEFPPMMMQSLVENAIKHGLEPKAEGGELLVRAEIVHGKLAVTVADTGLGFGKANTAGSGTGLANIRERLQLLYGAKATLAVAENQPAGTRVTITVPYVTHHKDDA